MAGDFSVSESGAAVYSVGLDVPPGTAGLVPSLKVVYSSSQGNTLLGPGWALDGLSALSRCPTTISQDGFIDPVDGDASDKLCLDGTRLVTTSADYWASAAEYRTENESFSRVKSQPSSPGNVRSYTVETKQGLKYSYGIDDQSRVRMNTGAISSWRLSRVEDTSGNFWTVEYEAKPESGTLKPIAIRYTGNTGANLAPYNTIQFLYESRPDPQSQSSGTVSQTLDERLAKIRMRVDGAVAWEYRFEYIQDRGTNRSLLTQLTQCSGTGLCLAPTRFDWEQTLNAFSEPQLWWPDATNNQNYPEWNDGQGLATALIDVNGDGLPDRTFHKNFQTNAPGLWVAYNTGTGFNPATLLHNNTDARQNRPQWVDTTCVYSQLIDMNGDGLLDRAYHNNYQENRPGLWVGLNTGTSIATPTLWFQHNQNNGPNCPVWSTTTGVFNQLIDMNGDQRPDRVAYHNYATNEPGFWVWINTGNGFGTAQRWELYPNSGWNQPVWRWANSGSSGEYQNLMDMNGDNLLDRVFSSFYQTDAPGLFVKLSTGSGIFPAWYGWYSSAGNDGTNFPVWRSSDGSVLHTLIDLDGDGLPDRVLNKNPLTGEDGLWVMRNLSRDLDSPKRWHMGGVVRQNRPIWSDAQGGEVAAFNDINGDGLPDRVFHYNYATAQPGLWASLNEGSKFGEMKLWYPHNLDNGPNLPHSQNATFVFNTLIDMNGDGIPDRVSHKNLTTNQVGLWVELNLNKSQNIVKISDSSGAVTEIEYGPLTDPTLHQVDHDAVYPARDIAPTWNVVRSYITSNGIGGTAQFDYHYSGLKVDLLGRGFSGFREISFVDSRTSITTTTRYRQDHPFKSMPYRKEIRLQDGTVINRISDTWVATNLSGGSYFPYVSQSVEETFDLDGSSISIVTSSKSFDTFGNPLSTSIDYGDGNPEVLTHIYSNNESNWILGRLTESRRVNGGRSGLPDRRSSFEYNATTGLLTKESVLTQDPSLGVTKTYTHDLFGNITSSTITAPQVEPRTTRTEYDARGQFVVRTFNALDQRETSVYESRTGQRTSTTGPNFLTTIWHYDDFGRLTRQVNADGTEASIARLLIAEDDDFAPDLARYVVRTDRSGSAPSLQYLDGHDRPLRQVDFGLDGRAILVDTEYNAFGDVHRVSDPYFDGDTPEWTVNAFDILGRLIQSTAPGNRVSTTGYDGLTTTVTNPLKQVQSQTTDVRGRVARVTDNFGGTIRYAYDSYGNLEQLTDPAGNITRMLYDEVGNRLELDDPDSGTTVSVFDALGQLKSTTDARGLRTTFSYDRLGRPTGRADATGIRVWTYDTATHGIGKIAQVSRTISLSTGDAILSSSFESGEAAPVVQSSTHVQTLLYDSLGRTSQTTTSIDGTPYVEGLTYDNYSRLSRYTYPSGFSVTHRYTVSGLLSEVRDGVTDAPYWIANAANARGQLERETLGNGVISTRQFNRSTGYLESIRSIGSLPVQDLTHQFDLIGNLSNRHDTLRSLHEGFRYDGLNRLKEAQVTGQAADVFQYDAIGNITSRSRVGTYTYGAGSAGPHAVTSITGPRANTYQYDSAGNRIADVGGAVTYDAEGLPTRIQRGSNDVRFAYDAAGQRYRQVELAGPVVQQTKLYVGANYEEEAGGGLTKRIHYIRGGDSVAAIKVLVSNGTQSLRYLHRDHLGSIDTISDEAGQVVERLSFDAWGERRDPVDWVGPGQPAVSTDRGFTGHEHLDSSALIHMNGRVYDPMVGRFLSPDPFIQAPDNTQNLNRYSYVLNNPLSYTDPSGFFFGKLFKAIKRFITKNKVLIISAAIGIATGVWFPGLLEGVGITGLTNAVLSGAAAGFAGSSSATIAAGGSISDALKAGLKGAGYGGLSAGIFNKIGAASLSDTERVLAHGVAGGGLEVTQGGKFEHGFFSGVVTRIFSPDIAASVKNPALGTAVAAVIGGTAAQLSGGKFANGAVTGSFAYLFSSVATSSVLEQEEGAPNGSGRQGRSDLEGMAADPMIRSKIDDAWTASNPYGQEAGKREQGFWIVLDSKIRVLSVQQPLSSGTRDSLIPGPTPKGAVAFFHTHPNTTTEGYRPNPSSGDIKFSRSRNIPGIIKSHNGMYYYGP